MSQAKAEVMALCRHLLFKLFGSDGVQQDDAGPLCRHVAES
jgi:hypothetical protein